MKTIKTVLAMVVIVLVVALTGCGNDTSASSDSGSGQFDDSSQSTCFMQMTLDQKAQLTQYVATQHDNINSTTNNSDGTQDVCVLEQNSSGGYDQHYYNQSDHFGDYLLYTMLVGRSTPLMTYGLISGDLDVSQVLALSLLSGVNSSGQMYHPYMQSNGNWGRSAMPIDNSYVSNVRYGARSAVPFSQTMPYPPGYKPVPLSFKSDSVVNVTKDASGKVTLTKTPAKASDTLKSFPKPAPPAAKNGVQNATKPGGSVPKSKH